MEEKLNECYKRMFEQCIKAIPIEWTEVRIRAEKYDQEECLDYHSLTVYKDKYGKWHRSSEIEQEVSAEADFFFVRNSPTKIIKDIYKVFAETGMECFKMFTYIVDAEGKVEVNYQYEYSQGEDFIERMTLWEYKTTGFVGTDFDKKIIKKYHPEFEG